MTNSAAYYDSITHLNFTSSCTVNESNIDMSIPTLLLTIPCGPWFLCLMKLMVYTIIKPLINR